MRPPTGLLVVLGALTISLGEPSTSRAVWLPWIRRLLLVSLGLAFGEAEWFTSMFDALVGQ